MTDDPKRNQPKPTWTERSVPETVRPGTPTRQLSLDDWDAMVPASDAVVKSAYARPAELPTRPLMRRGDEREDALVIQKGAKQARVLNFDVEGIHWRAGFAPEITQTPVNQYVNSQVPPVAALEMPNGFAMRPATPDYDRVLRDIIPPALLSLEEQMFGRGREMGGFYMYFIPHGAGATAGAMAWYRATPTGKAHILYLQTEVKRADVRILDEMARTFDASLVAVKQQGPVVRPFDFWQELRDASAEVSASFQGSSITRNAEDVKARLTGARIQAEDRLATGLDVAFEKTGVVVNFLTVTLPQFFLARFLRVFSRFAIVVIQRADAFLERRLNRHDGLPPPPP